MPQKRKDGSEYDHNYVELRLRAAMFNTPDEQAVLVALQLLWWWFKGEARGLDMIKAVLIDPDMKKLPAEDPAFQTQISEKGIKRALASLRRKGQVETERLTNAAGYRGPMGFRMTVEDIDYNAAYQIFLGRLKQTNPRLWTQYASKKQIESVQPTLFEEQKETTPLPLAFQMAAEVAKVKTGKHPQQDAFWKHCCGTWARDHAGQTMAWPRAKGFQENLNATMWRLGLDENIRRWDNLQADPFTNKKSLLSYLFDPDAWIKMRGPNVKGNANGRGFQQPETPTDWTPGHEV